MTLAYEQVATEGAALRGRGWLLMSGIVLICYGVAVIALTIFSLVLLMLNMSFGSMSGAVDWIMLAIGLIGLLIGAAAGGVMLAGGVGTIRRRAWGRAMGGGTLLGLVTAWLAYSLPVTTYVIVSSIGDFPGDLDEVGFLGFAALSLAFAGLGPAAVLFGLHRGRPAMLTGTDESPLGRLSLPAAGIAFGGLVWGASLLFIGSLAAAVMVGFGGFESEAAPLFLAGTIGLIASFAGSILTLSGWPRAGATAVVIAVVVGLAVSVWYAVTLMNDAPSWRSTAEVVGSMAAMLVWAVPPAVLAAAVLLTPAPQRFQDA